MSCCQDCADLKLKHDSATGHFKTELLKLKEEIETLKKQVCTCTCCDKKVDLVTDQTPKTIKPVAKKIVKKKTQKRRKK